MNVERDRLRRAKAHAILSRPAPDRRALKRARRLLKDANRDQRIAANKQWNAALAGMNVGLKQFGAAMDRVTENMHAAAQGIAAAFARSRIPILPPGDEIRMLPMTTRDEQFVSFPMRHAGRTALQAKEAADREARGIKTYHITELSAQRARLVDYGDIDHNDPRLAPLQRVRDRLEASMFLQALGEPFVPALRCKCGVMLYGDSCRTCGFEANETKQSD